MSVPPARLARRPRAFTLTELLAVAVIFVILLSIFVPYVRSKREDAHRARCADNLRQIREAFAKYMQQNGDNYPSARGDAQRPTGYRAFTGPDAADPFAADSAVQPNDVTASLWLLVRGGLAEPKLFVCPSTWDRADARGTSTSPRSNFRGGANLSYSYATPFAAPTDYRLKGDWVKPGFAVIADRNPGVSVADGDDVLAAGD
ncbi:MAG TPA: type II secretion system protein, partial [Tepidisphaeraceae bacterium]|nr:type II secretion system protein [Tepidisphaeraceae bacterium]